jgi:hypothetical protein
MPEPLRILAGDCTVTDEDAEETRRERGNVVTICTSDNCRELLVGRPEQARGMWVASFTETMAARTAVGQGYFYT